ncbi:phenylacetate--CoA ligase family protein [Paeniglutamicibacter kerguelensis]|uniref:Phenylacetate-coenzyme A ligase PaaK-like adenylate-forming protein n=1 Tax=Paeniglutamicibacter kerguelensis TaxID=254788 RepID=A0ABS4XHT1_9MICC|nr:phenylacetate--CoA ligase family protein [Paeniglutamicibacter kerguelensis]MBP2387963.1 phenylacetate-coenzyme A ligase PaaK-like adenylate-forming protein [Paeniglutamicibacter kerguelensis]
MDLRLISRVLFLRAAWRRRDRWDAALIAKHQDHALQELRRAAYTGSEFYRRHHAGLHVAPLNELPPVTKADLMEHFDEAITSPGLRLADLETHLQSLTRNGADPGVPWQGRWWAASTAGTTGRRGTFVWNRSEWGTVLASYARANDWAGIAAGPTRPLKAAIVSSRIPTHQSAVVGASLRSKLVPTLRLDVTAPLGETVAALNGFQPRILVGYASALKPLAAEQHAGRLRISPQGVISASEVLTPHTAAELEAAWGSPPFDVYAATETAGIASPCIHRNRHVYEDLLIIEPVDRDGNPVPPGTTGARLLVTVLFSRTLPLIRYEMSDTVRLGGRGCPCGRAFRLMEDIEGRTEDILHLPGKAGTVAVHPLVFHHVLDQAALTGWQIIQEPGRLRVLMVGLSHGNSQEGVRAAVQHALAEAGVMPTGVDVRIVDRLERTALGKAPFVRGLKATP